MRALSKSPQAFGPAEGNTSSSMWQAVFGVGDAFLFCLLWLDFNVLYGSSTDSVILEPNLFELSEMLPLSLIRSLFFS
ncbi:hypothetical protein Pan54_04320 [Rubinisphaera italica]|uniref:Uncharacterized protein n=1 Tax=Rubinisphaera italica TaxID=2527969 RepID=A0A5C5XCT1_9PLAN|nr:hypothetical protein Pan54_04320 [Rubinisphaera italica]